MSSDRASVHIRRPRVDHAITDLLILGPGGNEAPVQLVPYALIVTRRDADDADGIARCDVIARLERGRRGKAEVFNEPVLIAKQPVAAAHDCYLGPCSERRLRSRRSQSNATPSTIASMAQTKKTANRKSKASRP